MKRKLLSISLILLILLGMTACGGAPSEMSASPSVIIDTDPGTDDSTALLLAQAGLGARVKLVVSSYGNSPLEQTTANAAKLADLYGMSADILQGAAGPMAGAREPQFSEGADGIASAGLPESDREILRTDTSDYLYEFLRENPGTEYVVLGPMTNLAALLEKHPQAEKLIGRVVTMAGGFEEFNMDDCAEFNIHCDPIAAKRVFESGLKIHMVPLDTTNQLPLSHEELLAIPDGKTSGSEYLRAILLDNERVSMSWGLPGAVIYDASALAYLLQPELFTTRTIGVAVSDGADYGSTTETGERSNVTLVEAPNREGIYKLICDSAHGIFS